jgi:phosphoglycolate phosphatase
MSGLPPLEPVPIGRARLVLFDLDGVLWDSRDNMACAWREVQERLGVTVPFATYFAAIGRPFAEIMAQIGLGQRTAEIERVFRIASMANMQQARFYPGASEMLRRLQAAGLRIGVVTSKDELRTSAILAMLPVTFDVVRTPDRVCRGKPAPDHLLAAAAFANVDPRETVYVGDMDSDFEAAARARIGYAHAGWGYGAVPPGSLLVLDRIDELDLFLPEPGMRSVMG